MLSNMFIWLKEKFSRINLEYYRINNVAKCLIFVAICYDKTAQT